MTILREETGQVTNVADEDLGSITTVAAAAGDDQLVVRSGFPFDARGGVLVVGTQRVRWTSVEKRAGILTLARPLAAAVDVNEPVLVWDKARGSIAVEKTARVSLGEGMSDDVHAVVNSGLLSRLPDGPRPAGEGEIVIVRETNPGSWRLVDVVGVGDLTAANLLFDVVELTVTVAGDQVVELANLPADGSVRVFINNEEIDADDGWTVDGAEVNIDGSLVTVGDLVAIEYAYLEPIAPERVPDPPGLVDVQASIDTIEQDIADTIELVNSGDSALAQQIEDVVDEVNDELALRPPPVESTAEPGTTDMPVGTVWERYNTLTPAGGAPRKLIGAWRSKGGGAWDPVSIDPTYIPVLDINTGTAGSLATSRLLVTDLTEYVRDPSMEGIGTWAFVGKPTRWSYSTNSPRTGDRNGKHLRVSIEDTGVHEVEEDFVPVTPGDRYLYTALYRRAGNAQASGSLIFRLYYYDAAKAIIPSLGYYNQISVGVSTLTDYTWRELVDGNGDTGFETVIPDGVAYVKVKILVNGVPAGGSFYDFDEVHLRKKFGGAVFIDGELKARHAAADLVTGLLVRGDVFETDEDPAKGIKFSNNGLLGYDNDTGEVKTVLDPTRGVLAMIGGTMEAGRFEGGSLFIAQGVAGSITQAFSGTSLPAGWASTKTTNTGTAGGSASVPGVSVVSSGPTGQVGSALLVDYGPAGLSAAAQNAGGEVTYGLADAADADVTVRFRSQLLDGAFGGENCRLAIRRQDGNAWSSTSDGIALELIGAAAFGAGYSFPVISTLNGSDTTLGTVLIPTDPTASWHKARLRVAAGVVAAKVWQDGTPEPADWQVAVQHAGVVTAGKTSIIWNQVPFFDSTSRGQKVWIDRVDAQTLVSGFAVNPDGTGEWPAVGIKPPDATWRVVGSAGQPAFQNSWTGTCKFRRTPTGDLLITGDCTIPASAHGKVMFTLPVGHRPTTDFLNNIIWQNTTPRIASMTVNADGTVVWENLSITGGTRTIFTLSLTTL